LLIESTMKITISYFIVDSASNIRNLADEWAMKIFVVNCYTDGFANRMKIFFINGLVNNYYIDGVNDMSEF
jgi:hypothetical protein